MARRCVLSRSDYHNKLTTWIPIVTTAINDVGSQSLPTPSSTEGAQHSRGKRRGFLQRALSLRQSQRGSNYPFHTLPRYGIDPTPRSSPSHIVAPSCSAAGVLEQSPQRSAAADGQELGYEEGEWMSREDKRRQAAFSQDFQSTLSNDIASPSSSADRRFGNGWLEVVSPRSLECVNNVGRAPCHKCGPCQGSLIKQIANGWTTHFPKNIWKMITTTLGEENDILPIWNEKFSLGLFESLEAITVDVRMAGYDQILFLVKGLRDPGIFFVFTRVHPRVEASSSIEESRLGFCAVFPRKRGEGYKAFGLDGTINKDDNTIADWINHPDRGSIFGTKVFARMVGAYGCLPEEERAILHRSLASPKICRADVRSPTTRRLRTGERRNFNWLTNRLLSYTATLGRRRTDSTLHLLADANEAQAARLANHLHRNVASGGLSQSNETADDLYSDDE